MTRLNMSEAAGWRPPRLAQMRPMTHYWPWKAGYMGNLGSGPFRLVPGCLPCRQTSRAHARRADIEGPPARSLILQTVLTRGRLRPTPTASS
jgi:hypothetical protein